MRLIIFGGILAVALVASGARAQESHWLTFSMSSIHTGQHSIRVVVDPFTRGGYYKLWIAKRVEQIRYGPEQTTWAESDTCPAMMPALARLQSIEPLTILPPGVSGPPTDLLLDGGTYRVHARGYWPHTRMDGEITLSGTDLTPVARWFQDTMKALNGCWSNQRPDR